MTIEEQQNSEIAAIGARYALTLDELTSQLCCEEAQAYFLGIVFQGLLVQFLERRGPHETAALLRRTADRVDAEAKQKLQ